MSNLVPDMQADRIQDIDLELLWRRGIRGLVFDLDNTITPWHQYGIGRRYVYHTSLPVRHQ